MESTSFIAITIFVGILSLLAIFYLKLGRLGFWIIASKLPVEFMEFAQKNDHVWVISNSSTEELGSEYIGPFKLVAFRTTYTLYALRNEFEKSQAEFVALYGDDIPKKGFPLPSLLSLIYPIVAMANHPNPNPEIIETLGYGFANLGYLLFAALLPGTFRILGMEKRTQILFGALIFFGIGAVLVNVPLRYVS